MHYKLEDIPLRDPVRRGEGCMRSIRAGDMEIGATWTTGPADYSFVYKGLPGDVCPCEHYGYVFSGRIRARYADGTEEVIGPGEAYWIPAGHVLIYEEATHHLEINPHEQLEQLMKMVQINAERRLAEHAAGNGDN